MNKYSVILFLFFLLHLPIQSQHLNDVQILVKELTDEECFGRGYLKNGDAKAAEKLKKEMAKINLQMFGNSYEQPFGFPVIRFPEQPTLKFGETALTEGRDFVPAAGCPKIEGTWSLYFVDSATFDNTARWNQFMKKKMFGKMLVLDFEKLKNIQHSERLNEIKTNGHRSRGQIWLVSKITWSVESRFDPFPVIQIVKSALPVFAEEVTLDINPEFVPSYQTRNLLGFVKGQIYPDSFIVFTAHYDHLGGIGKEQYFPGANDNASGVALVLDLARHFSENPLPCSVAFLLFSGEEAGLMGSYYYTTHPIFPLSQIMMLMNIDLAGTGEKGATFVNGLVHKALFDTLVHINRDMGYLPAGLFPRDKAANSDHYWFSELGVPSLFMYLMGDYPWYHDTGDKAENLPWGGYPGAFRLMRDFAKNRAGLKI